MVNRAQEMEKVQGILQNPLTKPGRDAMINVQHTAEWMVTMREESGNPQNITAGEDFSRACDEDLAVASRISDGALCELIARYQHRIKKKALSMASAPMASAPFDAEDLMQEGLLGLLNAARTFQRERGAKFSTYANVCVTNKITTALFKSNRTGLSEEELEKALQSAGIQEDSQTPESILLEKEMARELSRKVRELLTDREWQVFRLFLNGSTYHQMARRLNISPKTVDNALQRVRKKLKLVWKDELIAK